MIQMNAVVIVPMGIGCDIGGRCGNGHASSKAGRLYLPGDNPLETVK
jgi:hypothetical protein